MGGHSKRCVNAVVFALLACIGLSCNRTPTSPSTPGSLAIANLQAAEVGVAHVVCHLSQFDYTAIDQLTFDVNRTETASLLGSTITQQDAGSPTPLGTINACTFATNPCSGFSACVLPSSTQGSVAVRVYAPVAWTPQKTWNISLTTTGVQSNTLTALITRPNELPWGNFATIVELTITRTGSTTGNMTFTAFSPGIPGRKIVFTLDVSGADRVYSIPYPPTAEVAGRNTEGIFGGVLLPTGEALIVLTMEERDAAGVVLTKESQSRVVK